MVCKDLVIKDRNERQAMSYFMVLYHAEERTSVRQQSIVRFPQRDHTKRNCGLIEGTTSNNHKERNKTPASSRVTHPHGSSSATSMTRRAVDAMQAGMSKVKSSSLAHIATVQPSTRAVLLHNMQRMICATEAISML